MPKKGFKSLTLKEKTYEKIVELGKKLDLTPPEVVVKAVESLAVAQ